MISIKITDDTEVLVNTFSFIYKEVKMPSVARQIALMVAKKLGIRMIPNVQAKIIRAVMFTNLLLFDMIFLLRLLLN